MDKQATATEKGSRHEECIVCGYKKAAVEISATGTTAKDPSVPQTGDDSNIFVWIALMLISGAGMTVTIVYSRKRKYGR